jgi:predicted porin
MKKRFLVAAVAATLVSPLAANAAATVYGNAHVTIDSYDVADSKNGNTDNLVMNSRTSSIGVKGKEDLGGGMTALFKLEWQLDPSERATSITDRDQWVGLKGAMGTVKFGTMTNNYKQTGSKVDPMYRTALEGRGMMNMQSGLHGSFGQNGGRSTNTVQFTSPKMSGVQAVFNTTFSGADDETLGLGVRYTGTKNLLAYFDYIDAQGGTGGYKSVAAGTSETAIKVGGKYKMDALTIGAQFESAEDVIGSDIIFVSANYKMNDNDNVALTLGDVDKLDDMGFAVMYNHKMSKRTNVYAGYGDNASTGNATTGNDNQVTTFGIRHKF